MIPVASIAPVGQTQLETDWYVPIRFRVCPGARADSIVGTVGNRGRDISELKIDRTTGELYGFTLVGIGRPATTSPTNPFGALPAESGIPLIDLTRLSFEDGTDGGPAHFDVPTILQCGLIGDSLAVVFDQSAPPSRLIDSGEGMFLLADDALVGFTTKPLRSGDLSVVRQWMDSSARLSGGTS